jgi:hypothetical protein
MAKCFSPTSKRSKDSADEMDGGKKYNSEPDFFAEFAKLDKLDKEQE